MGLIPIYNRAAEIIEQLIFAEYRAEIFCPDPCKNRQQIKHQQSLESSSAVLSYTNLNARAPVQPFFKKAAQQKNSLIPRQVQTHQAPVACGCLSALRLTRTG